MSIFFDYEKIYVVSGGNSDLIVYYFKALAANPTMYPNLVGSSFILNETIVTKNPYKLTNRQLAEYLGVLALRSYANYKFTKDSGLDIEAFPSWVPKQVVTTNPLIAINRTKLNFIEEIKYVN